MSICVASMCINLAEGGKDYCVAHQLRPDRRVLEAERERVLALRAAFIEGYLKRYGEAERNLLSGFTGVSGTAARFAEARYPMPKVERPRTWTDGNGTQFRVSPEKPGRFEITHPRSDGLWFLISDTYAVPVCYAAPLADLQARPTEMVEA